MSHFGLTEKHCEGETLHEAMNARQAMRKAQAERDYTHLGDKMSLEAAIDAAAASEENYYHNIVPSDAPYGPPGPGDKKRGERVFL